MENTIFVQLSLVMVMAAAVSLLMRAFRQPLIIGYIITGFLVGPGLLHLITNQEAFHSFSQIGIALLLFIIGLGLNVNVMKDTGKPVLITFLANTVGIGLLGFGTSWLLGFNATESVILAAALFYSSTIIVIKSLSDKKEQSRLYGQIAVGILLAEDIAATIALVIISASTGNASTVSDFASLILKGVGLGAGLAFVGGYIMPKLSKLFASSQELLYVFALGWAFGIASLFLWAGFSIEIGALFAGAALAHLPYVQAISTRLKPLRDFFIVLFFIKLGEELGIDNLSQALIPAIVLSAITLISKPIIMMGALGWLGYTIQTSFKAAIHLSQISEFSIILVILAESSGLVGDNLISVVTMTALMTIAISAYLMKYDDQLYTRFSSVLSIFERAKTKREMKELGHYPLVLIGYYEGGYTYVETFKKMKKPYVVIDYDPDIIDSLDHRHINHIYGDVTDTELLEEIGLKRAEVVVSTIRDINTNMLVADHINSSNDETVFVCPADTLDEAERLYEIGADYVLLPHFIGNNKVNDFLKHHGSNKEAFLKYRRKDTPKVEDTSYSE